jgi:hypothetical protein
LGKITLDLRLATLLDTLSEAKAGICIPIHPGTGRRGIRSCWEAGHHTGGMADRRQTVAGKNLTCQNPEGRKSVTQFLSENK